MTSSTESYPDFDPSMLADLEQSLPREDFRGFIKDYLTSAQDRLKQAESLAAAGDLAALAKEAHILVSTAGSYGIMRASVSARELETACKAGDVAQVKTLMSELAASSRRAFAVMTERFLSSTD